MDGRIHRVGDDCLGSPMAFAAKRPAAMGAQGRLQQINCKSTSRAIDGLNKLTPRRVKQMLTQRPVNHYFRPRLLLGDAAECLIKEGDLLII